MRTNQVITALRSLLARFSLRTTLAVLLAVVALVIIADRTRDVALRRHNTIDRAHEQLMSAAQGAADRQTAIIQTVKALLRLAASLPASAADSGSACEVPFRSIVADMPWISTLQVVDRNGQPTCSTSDVLMRSNVSDRQYFIDAVASRKFVLSDYIVSRLTGKPIIAAAMPRITDGEIETMMLAGISIQWFSEVAAESGRRYGAEVLLLDGDGTVLAAYPDEAEWVGRNLAGADGFDEVLSLSRGATQSRQLAGHDRLMGHIRLPDSRAALVLMQKTDTVLALANRAAVVEIMEIAVGGLLLLACVWLGGEYYVIGPIRRLTEGARRLGGGDFAVRIDTSGQAPELRALGDSFNIMANHLAQQTEALRRANARLGLLAATDPLTGLANRRAFEEQMEAEWSRAIRSGAPLALLAIDIDHFKPFNDRYGHLEGDNCLRQVAEVLKGGARRRGDIASRTGGEEFAILLPGADLDDALLIGESLRRQAQALATPHPDSPEGCVTLSIGIAAMRPAQGEDPRVLLHAADAALYRAKRSGRNRVFASEDLLSLAS